MQVEAGAPVVGQERTTPSPEIPTETPKVSQLLVDGLPNKTFYPLLEKFCPLFKHIARLGSHFALKVVHFAHFQVQARKRKRGVLGSGWGCSVYLHIP